MMSNCNYSSATIRNIAILVIVVFSLVSIVQTQQCDGTCRGFASMEGGTYGGGSSASVVVKTIEELRSACGSGGAAVIKVSGEIRTGPTPVLIGSNKSIIGEMGAVIYGGLEVGAGSSNVVIQALVVVGTGVDNAVTVRQSRNVWIHHCDFSNSAKDLIYVAPNADLCTVSWNKFKYQEAVPNRYACNIGDANVSADVRVTLHNNYFSENIVQGMAAVRGGKTHFVNNYSDYIGAKSGLGVDVKAAVLVEANSLLDANVGLVVDINLGTLVTGTLNVVGNVLGGLLGGTTTRSGGTFIRAPYTLDVVAAADVASLVKVCANVNVAL